MNKLLLIFAAIMAYSATLSASPPRDSVINDALINEQLIDRQALILEIVQSQAPIQNAEDLQLHLDNQKSPINKLTAEARDQFVQSVVFTENGVGGFSYLPLLELPQGDIYQIAKLFGLQFELPILDHSKFDKGDKNTFSLLQCDGDTVCIGDRNNAVCVVSDHNTRRCEPFYGATCSSSCSSN